MAQLHKREMKSQSARPAGGGRRGEKSARGIPNAPLLMNIRTQQTAVLPGVLILFGFRAHRWSIYIIRWWLARVAATATIEL